MVLPTSGLGDICQGSSTLAHGFLTHVSTTPLWMFFIPFHDTLADLFSIQIYASAHFLHFPCFSTCAPSRFLLDSMQRQWYFYVIFCCLVFIPSYPRASLTFCAFFPFFVHFSSFFLFLFFLSVYTLAPFASCGTTYANGSPPRSHPFFFDGGT